MFIRENIPHKKHAGWGETVTNDEVLIEDATNQIAFPSGEVASHIN